MHVVLVLKQMQHRLVVNYVILDSTLMIIHYVSVVQMEHSLTLLVLLRAPFAHLAIILTLIEHYVSFVILVSSLLMV